MPTEQEQQMFEQLHGRQQLKRPNPPTPPRSQSQHNPTADRPNLAAMQAQADSQKASAQTSTAANTALTLNNVQHHIERVTASRANTIAQVSDVLAYLHSPALLEAEIWAETTAKIAAIESGAFAAESPYGTFQIALPQSATRFLSSSQGAIAEAIGHAR